MQHQVVQQRRRLGFQQVDVVRADHQRGLRGGPGQVVGGPAEQFPGRPGGRATPWQQAGHRAERYRGRAPGGRDLHHVPAAPAGPVQCLAQQPCLAGASRPGQHYAARAACSDGRIELG